MIIELTGLSREGKTLSGEDPASILGLEGVRDIRAEAPIRHRVTACMVGRELIVRGSLASEAAFQCSRCAVFFTVPFRNVPFEHAREVEAGVESVDLTDEVRETMLLAFPAFPVCSDGCRGLCAQCGADLNVETCDCRPPPQERWDALDGLKLG